MRKKHVVAHYIGFCRWISKCAVSNIVGTSTRCLGACCIPITGKKIWLIECDPIFHSITKFFEAQVHVVLIIIPDCWNWSIGNYLQGWIQNSSSQQFVVEFAKNMRNKCKRTLISPLPDHKRVGWPRPAQTNGLIETLFYLLLELLNHFDLFCNFEFSWTHWLTDFKEYVKLTRCLGSRIRHTRLQGLVEDPNEIVLQKVLNLLKM
jgi:hypothetical protein